MYLTKFPMAQQLTTFVMFTMPLLFLCRHGSSLVSPTSVSNINNITDWEALVSFKSMISSDPRGPLASWNDSIHYCNWPGVACSSPHHPQRVVSLDLSFSNLTGSISPAIVNLTFLQKIDLSSNRLQGIIPDEIGRLSLLQHLNLSSNSLEGGIPASLSHCSHLQNISIQHNYLNGEIPSGLGNCSDLRILTLLNNSLTGHIPPSLTNLSSLMYMSLRNNQLTGVIPSSIGNLNSLTILHISSNQLSGVIPSSLGKLDTLTTLNLYDNDVTGAIPPSLWNISSLSLLYMGHNNLTGQLPPYLGQALPWLEHIQLFENQFHGPIPVSLSNATHLKFIELYRNRFSGKIPPNLGSLQELRWLNLDENQVEAMEPDDWRFLARLTNCTNLELLDLNNNNLGGILPDSIANFSNNLQDLGLGNNYISGIIPREIANLSSLTTLRLDTNLLAGPIPDSIGKLQYLNALFLDGNKLSGNIPSTVGNLTQLNYLYLSFNELSGTIPASLGNCNYLSRLSLGFNKLTGDIPEEILIIPGLSIYLGLQSNELTGLLPAAVSKLKNLASFNVRKNKLSGKIPETLGECKMLEKLDLSENFFQGNIPMSLSSLRGIQELDVSQNNFSGKIPDFLQDLPYLSYLNLSFNNFEGSVPRLGVFANASAYSILGNNKLCGVNPGMKLQACPTQSSKKKDNSRTLLVIISIVSSSMFLLMLFGLLVVCRWIPRRSNPQNPAPMKEQHVKLSYAQLVRATNGFSVDNIVGRGSFGTVYKGALEEDSTEVIAVKVFHLDMPGATKSFIAECDIWRNIRHRNLVKILTACSSVDFKGNDFKALVSEFMANGSLDYWLHSRPNEESQPNRLKCIQRMNIVIDIATALDYLHNHGEAPIIHCDLKPSNILLDDDMVARLGDFGLARFIKMNVGNSSEYSSSSIGLKGTIGYVAPEYGMANGVSTLGDVYSYGILLLEMFTGKRPTDGIFKEGLTIRKFVESAFPDRVMDIVDAHLLLEEDGENEYSQNRTKEKIMECVASLLRIGISCSSGLPAERKEMNDICKELHGIRNMFITNENREERSSIAQIRPEDPYTIV